MNRTWEAVQLAPSATGYASAVVGVGEHPPMVTEVMRKLVPLAHEPINVVMSIVLNDYRLLSYSLDGQPYVYAIIAFDRRS